LSLPPDCCVSELGPVSSAVAGSGCVGQLARDGAAEVLGGLRGVDDRSRRSVLGPHRHHPRWRMRSSRPISRRSFRPCGQSGRRRAARRRRGGRPTARRPRAVPLRAERGVPARRDPRVERRYAAGYSLGTFLPSWVCAPRRPCTASRAPSLSSGLTGGRWSQANESHNHRWFVGVRIRTCHRTQPTSALLGGSTPMGIGRAWRAAAHGRAAALDRRAAAHGGAEARRTAMRPRLPAGPLSFSSEAEADRRRPSAAHATFARYPNSGGQKVSHAASVPATEICAALGCARPALAEHRSRFCRVPLTSSATSSRGSTAGAGSASATSTAHAPQSAPAAVDRGTGIRPRPPGSDAVRCRRRRRSLQRRGGSAQRLRSCEAPPSA
jgi:hypothetical protein